MARSKGLAREMAVLAVLIYFLHSVTAIYDQREEDQRRLISTLFEKQAYNPLIRPVNDSRQSLNIRFALALSQIINVDEVNQLMKTNVWLQVYWYDFQLKWDPSQYGNIGSLRIENKYVWTPDFVLFNNAGGDYSVTYKSNCVLYANSEVHWIPPAIYQSSCSIDVRYFPFDQQTCEMKFGSWTHKGDALKYTFDKNRDKLDLVDYLKSGSWDIIDAPGRIDTIKDEVTGEQREQIVFKFVLRRKTLFYTVNLIIPCVLISFVSVFVFALPADAGEKMTLCISVLLALIVFLLLVIRLLPPSLSIPLIAKYLLFTFVMNLITICSTIVIINRNYRTPRTHKMPYWMRVVFLRELPKYLLMKRPDHFNRWAESADSPTHDIKLPTETKRMDYSFTRSADFVELTEVSSPGRRPDGPIMNNRRSRGKSPVSRDGSKGRSDSPDPYHFEMTPELQKTIEAIRFIYHHLKKEEEYETVLDDWKYVARVMDRLLLVIFLVVTLVGTVAVFMDAPHILEYVDQDQIIRDLLAYIKRAEDDYEQSLSA